MNEQNYMRDIKIWKRMGAELIALDYLASKILCDKEFNQVMDKKTWDGLFKVIHYIESMRSKAEDRMFIKSPRADTTIFYGDQNDIYPLVDEVRERIDREALQRLTAEKRNGAEQNAGL